MSQTDGITKLRPALILKILPKYKDYLVCGISTQLHQELPGIDLIIDDSAEWFQNTGLRQTSLIRLLNLAVVADSNVSGWLGYLPQNLLQELQTRLSRFIVS